MKISKHANKRLKQRVSSKKNCREQMAAKAFVCGYRHGETKGPLNNWMSDVFLKDHSGNEMRVFNEKLYLFQDGTLITVLNLPPYLKKNFKSLLKPGAEDEYKGRLESWKNGDLKLEEPEKTVVPPKIKQMIIVRDDLKINRGQMSVQVASASSRLVQNIMMNSLEKGESPDDVKKMMSDYENASRVCLRAADGDQLLEVKALADEKGIESFLNYGNGPMTKNETVPVCLILQPAEETVLREVTGTLTLLN